MLIRGWANASATVGSLGTECDPDVDKSEDRALGYGLTVGVGYRALPDLGIGLAAAGETPGEGPITFGIAVLGSVQVVERLHALLSVGLERAGAMGEFTCENVAIPGPYTYTAEFLRPRAEIGGRYQLLGREYGRGVWLGLALRFYLPSDRDGESPDAPSFSDEIRVKSGAGPVPVAYIGANF